MRARIALSAVLIAALAGCSDDDGGGGAGSGGSAGNGGNAGSAGSGGSAGSAGSAAGASGSSGSAGSGGASASKRVFISSETFEPDLGGAVQGDAACQAAADAASLGGTWMAWLSDASTTPPERFTQATIPYALLDGTVIADDFADLIDGQLAAPLNRDEHDQPAAGAFAWTGTDPDGSAGGDTCNDWQVAIAATGIRGSADATDGSWSNDGLSGCFFPQRLFCFEQ